jgi:ABC-type transport system involved in cytochrome c biogenesis permease subunit
MKFTKFIPGLIVAIAAAVVLSAVLPSRDKDFQTSQFGKLPVMLNGRLQPLDSVARNSLLVIRTKQNALLDNGKSLPAIDWLLEVFAKPEVANTRKIFRIDNPELLDLLKLPREEKYFSFNQFVNSLPDLQKEAQRIGGIEEKQRGSFERGVMKLGNAVWIYDRLKNSVKPEEIHDFAADIADYETVLKPGLAALQAREAGRPADEALLTKLNQHFEHYRSITNVAYPLLIPIPGKSQAEWETMPASLMLSLKDGEIAPATRAYARMCAAFHDNKPEEFNKALTSFQTWLEQNNFQPQVKKAGLEFFFNHFEPYYKALSLYVLIFLLACFSWLWIPQSGKDNSLAANWLRCSALYIMVLALAVHTIGLVLRIIIEGHPPVTNLYTSAIFIGYGTALLGLILERIFRDGIGLVAGSTLGFGSLIIAHHLGLTSPTGETIETLRAVLISNFWLTTHVLTIAIGYAATFFAGFLAIIYLVRGLFTPSLDKASSETLTRMVYGIVCFATLFSFIGTVTGGIWADQSWGRFWGWDVKENGALLIVLWNASILHARWSGMIKGRGLMNMAIFGNIVTSFSWFGVNMLGVGLHSYGFMGQAFKWLIAFMLSQLVLIGLGLIPEKYWKSFGKPPTDSGSRGIPKPATSKA